MTVLKRIVRSLRRARRQSVRASIPIHGMSETSLRSSGKNSRKERINMRINMNWRYQPVILETGLIGFIAVYGETPEKCDFFSSTLFEGLSTSVEEASFSMSMMLIEAACWKPVFFSEIKKGYVFESLVPAEERKKLVDSVLNGPGA